MTGEELAWVVEQPEVIAGNQPKSLYHETGARRRRAHHKSKRGCLNCKQRRIKCDEGRPACGQCTERRWPCDFPGQSTPVRKPSKVLPPTPPSTEGTSASSASPDATHGTSAPLSRNMKHACVLEFMARADLPLPSICEQPKYRCEDAIELVDHYEDDAQPWMGSPATQVVTQKHGIELALSCPYLMHAVLAYSAKHLSYLHPEVERYSVAATIHYTRSLQAYSSHLVYDIDRGNAAALLAASGLLAKLSFINTPVLTANTPLAADTAPVWIRSMQGVKTIMSTPALRTDLENGPMAHIWRAYHPSADTAPVVLETKPDTDLMNAMKYLCAQDTVAHVPNPFTSVLARLEVLMCTEPTHENIDIYLAFIATMESAFVELLMQREPRALLILAFWCARTCLIEQWWTGPSARFECRRICEYLSYIEDPMIQEMLRYPADSCGYQLPTAAQRFERRPHEVLEDV